MNSLCNSDNETDSSLLFIKHSNIINHRNFGIDQDGRCENILEPVAVAGVTIDVVPGHGGPRPLLAEVMLM